MKHAYCCCLATSLFICNSLHSQFYFSHDNNAEPVVLWELGEPVGAINCHTDIGGNSGAGAKFIKYINWIKPGFRKFIGKRHLAISYCAAV